jgi:dolichol-phosphate mannosyltransferase
MPSSAPPDTSIIIPVYNEEDSLDPLVKQISSAMKGRCFEIILVDDGSTDSSWKKIETLAKKIKIFLASVTAIILINHKQLIPA